jgi:hypothetical protein
VVTLAATATDNVGIGRVEFFVDNQLLGTATAAPYTLAWDTTGLAHNSVHTLHARAVDLAGNARQSATVSGVKVADVTPPTVAITGPAAGAALQKGQQVTIAATAADASGISKVEFRVGAGTATPALKCSDTSAPYACQWTTPSTAGTYTLEVKAIDKAGKVAVARVEVTVS